MIEHIAGVDCNHGHGFNGNVISAEEMRLCNTAQYIVKDNRELDQSPESDDEDFEREGKYFLSGLADRTSSPEGDCSVYPQRHGLSKDMWLEIYQRASALCLGGSELNHVPAFADWWNADGMHNPPPYHKAVLACGGQWFEYNDGSEFIAANPLQIPALTGILEAARRPQDFNAKDNSDYDIFGKLPNELRDMVLSSLGSKDIANLRSASRTFRHLPITLWRELIEKEMPWIWEV
jgi:hypothetical protein